MGVPDLDARTMSLFDPGPGKTPPPPMSADRRRTQRRQELLDQGINPGSRRPVANNGETCKTCKFLEVHGHNRSYFKCGRTSTSSSASSDIRSSWPACELWEAE